MQDKKIILFDGVCNFCNYWVRFVFKWNSKRDIYFLPLQDKRSEELLPNTLGTALPESVIYYRSGQVFTHSSAVLKICSELNIVFKLLSNIAWIIPTKIRDSIYSYIGKKRYKWFGQTSGCPIPSPELKKQFL